MPLLDHFHPPLGRTRRWESFHALWVGEVAASFNLNLLPTGYFAEVQAHVGNRVEVDVATFDRDHSSREQRLAEESSSSVATLTAPPKVWAPPEPGFSFPTIFPDVFEALVLKEAGSVTLVGAVEFVSPGNKDRPDARRAFAAKCASYLQAGVGLVVVDVVTSRQANLHDELIDLLELDEKFKLGDASPTYATAYQPVRREGKESVDTWVRRINVGEPLPILPLALRSGPCLPVELEETYAEVCRRSRLS